LRLEDFYVTSILFNMYRHLRRF